MIVAQMDNLLHRRLAIGSASAGPNGLEHTDARQDANLRHNRLPICATMQAQRAQ